ncbi:MAG: hypothetical protein U9Q40_06755 [Campylobacterota bacterium]|nr:hypothetical protein [Campylobacterota bacterium]
MKEHVKYENLEEELVDLQEVLKNSLQNDVLEIRKVDKSCDKFNTVMHQFCDLSKAEYVIFSKFMAKEYHNLETFIFLDATGKSICNLSGRDIDLYNMIKECNNLVEAKD